MYKLIKKIGVALNKINKDYYIHFIVSLLLTMVLYPPFAWLGLGVGGCGVSALLTILLGIGKELLDAKYGGDANPYDIVADFWGVFMGLVCIALFFAAVNIPGLG